MTNTLAPIYTGNAPPDPASNALWLSSSHRHMYVPPGPNTRRPVLGSGTSGNFGITAAAETSGWWNTELGRVESITNSGNVAIFSYAPSPYGPWTVYGNTYGNGVNGEANPVSQQMVLREGSTLYMFYCRNQPDLSVRMATSPVPTLANPIPVWTYQGIVWTDTVGGGSIWVMKNPWGGYYMFLERGDATLRLIKSPAAAAADLVAVPFTPFVRNLDMTMPFGIRGNRRWGRPSVFYEDDGTWIMYGHAIGTAQFGLQFAQRFICKPERDGDDPINWVADPDGPIVREENPFEADQIADFRPVEMANGVWWAFWSGPNNSSGAGVQMCAPMQRPLLMHDGGDWARILHVPDLLADFPYINADSTTSNQNIRNKWDVVFDTRAGATLTATAPRPASRVRFKLSNAPELFPGGHVKLAMLNVVDRICGPVAIATSVALGYISGTTLTINAPVTGKVQVGGPVRGVGVAADTVITGQLTGTGGAGTYTVNNSQTVGSSGAPITLTTIGLFATGTTVTMVTRQPHGLTTEDFVTVTGVVGSTIAGALATAFNATTSVQVASIVDPNTFTYVATTAPGTVLTLGCYDRSLRPGEVREYEATNVRGTFYRR